MRIQTPVIPHFAYPSTGSKIGAGEGSSHPGKPALAVATRSRAKGTSRQNTKTPAPKSGTRTWKHP